MAFFKKLKERLFNSSSKLEEGLDAIVEDGGEPSDEQDISDQTTPEILLTEPPVSKIITEKTDKAPEATATDSDTIQAELEASKVDKRRYDPSKTDFHPSTVDDEQSQVSSETEIIDVKKDDPAPVVEAPVEESVPSTGFLGRLMGRKAGPSTVRRILDDALHPQLPVAGLADLATCRFDTRSLRGVRRDVLLVERHHRLPAPEAALAVARVGNEHAAREAQRGERCAARVVRLLHRHGAQTGSARAQGHQKA